MQFFGQYTTEFNEEFLVESYLYFNKEGEDDLTIEELEQLIKNQKLKKKNIAGTIFMYNPYYYPIGYDEKKSLASQDFDFDAGFHHLKIEREITMFRASIKGYEGQLVEIRTLFNLNIKKIDVSEILVSLNDDTEMLNTNQFTKFHKESNYIDLNNFKINGKFVFFAWGHKINRSEFINIYNYAKSIYDKCIQMQKKIAFVFRKSTQEEYARVHFQFLHPLDGSKLQYRMPDALEKVFSTHPPLPSAFNDIK
ncbi:MAG: hypothetical protein KAQ94_06190 [Arcobacteraceae bacterium]|nr:hypothetical protein [Arcobacteraceae bacterium]